MSSRSWLIAFGAPAVWHRALAIGLPVGFLQICVNQGDHWLHGTVTRTIVVKTLLTPVIAVAVCLVSAASTYRPPASLAKVEDPGTRTAHPYGHS